MTLLWVVEIILHISLYPEIVALTKVKVKIMSNFSDFNDFLCNGL